MNLITTMSSRHSGDQVHKVDFFSPLHDEGRGGSRTIAGKLHKYVLPSATGFCGDAHWSLTGAVQLTAPLRHCEHQKLCVLPGGDTAVFASPWYLCTCTTSNPQQINKWVFFLDCVRLCTC